MEISKLHKLFLKSNGVSIDTRHIKEGAIFFALKGHNFDGNLFAENALKLGASYAVIDDEKHHNNNNTILVEDVLTTLQKLSSFHRAYLDIKIIAITGSNGKTTTKELFYSVLSEKYNCKATFGNLNNHIGVPLTLLSFNENTKIGIVEMGANHQKEIEQLCEIAKPDIGYITNFGKAHLEGFGGVEGVIKGKSEMYAFLRSNNRIALVNTDDKIQNENSKDINEKIEFSIHDLKIKIEDSTQNKLLSFYIGEHLVQTNLYGNYNLSNCMAAIALGIYLDLNIFEIINGINKYLPTNHRSQWIEKNNLKIVIDAYNANPTSMTHAINSFVELVESPKYIILGDMFELGIESDIEHQNIINILNKFQDIKVFYIGNIFYKSKIYSNSEFFYKTLDDFLLQIKNHQISSGYLLIKGSRGIKLEIILDYL